MSRYVNILEDAYALDRSEREWMTKLIASYARNHPELERFYGFSYVVDPVNGIDLPFGYEAAGGLGDEVVLGVLEGFGETASPEVLSVLFGQVICNTMSEQSRALGDSGFMDVLERHGFADVAAMTAGNAAGSGFIFGSFLTRPERLSKRRVDAMDRCARHVAAARRLRVALAGRHATDRAEWIYEPGRDVVHHAEGSARGRLPLELLRQEAKERDGARRRHVEPDERLVRWKELVDGQWTLVDHFDTDDRRFVLAIPNADHGPGSPKLSKRKTLILELLCQGLSQTEIAYEIGSTTSTVATHVRGLREAFRVANDAELVVRVNQWLGLPRQELELEDAECVVAQGPHDDALVGLTPAERAIVSSIRMGERDAEIAAGRGVQVKTVRNQIHQIYQRLGVHSRAELCAKFTK